MNVEKIQASELTPQALKSVESNQTGKVANSIFNNTEEAGLQNGPKDKEKTIEALKKEIQSGNAECISQWKYLFRQMDRHKLYRHGSFIMLDRVPEGCKTLGDVKRKLNLPTGCLVNNNPKLNGGGDLGDKDAEAPLSISVDKLAEGLGMSPKEIKELFE